MMLNNAKNEVLFKETANNSSSFVFTVPPKIQNVAIVLDKIKITSASPMAWLIVQTASNSGVFNTTGYVTGTFYSNSTGWGNQNSSVNAPLATGLPLTAGYDSTTQYQSGCIYITDLNTPNNSNCVGEVLDFDASLYYIYVVGQSPTTSTSIIRIQMTSSTIDSGNIVIYSLPSG